MRWHNLAAIYFSLFAISCDDVEPHGHPIRYQYFNLDSSTDRREAIEKRFEAANIQATRFRAVSGKDLNVETLLEARLYDKSAFEQSRGREARAGELGYHMSFMNYLASAARSPRELIVHLDDDAVFGPTLDADLRKAIALAPPDWEVLYLGCNRDRVVGEEGHIFGFPGYQPRQGGDFKLCPSGAMTQAGDTPWYRLHERCIAGSYALIVRPKKAQELLPHFLEMSSESDMLLRGHFSGMNAYCIYPALVDLAPVLSTIKADAS